MTSLFVLSQILVRQKSETRCWLFFRGNWPALDETHLSPCVSPNLNNRCVYVYVYFSMCTCMCIYYFVKLIKI